MQKQFFLLGCLFFLGITFGTAQWTQKKGTGYYKVGAWFLEANKHYTDKGLLDPNATRGIFVTSLYGRHGITDKITLVGYIPFTRVYQNEQVFTSGNPGQPGEAVNSFGDIDLAVEVQIFKRPKWVLATSLTLGIPSGNNSGGSDGSYQTGDGEFNQIVKVLAGTSFKIAKYSFYAKGSLGVNNRSNGYSDEIRLGFETGSQVFKNKFLFLVRLNTIQSFFNGSLSAENSNGSIFANNVEVTNLGGEINYFITKKWSASFGHSIPLSGKNIYKAPALAGGIAYKL
ncbi:transporter [Flavobacteriaceae bacterium]|nr:transporter [Flavobacteriaceae bacterium]